MKNSFKRFSEYLVFWIFVLLFINSISAEIKIGNISGDLETLYSPGEKLKGWINISLVNESSDSVLYFFDQGITLIELLRKNGVSDWSCVPSSCEDFYTSVGSGSSTKTFDINKGESKTFGLLLKGTISRINDLRFDVSSNVGASCREQLKIDLFDDKDFDWIPLKSSSDFNCLKLSGNYNSSEELNYWRLNPNTPYCEKIRIPPAPLIQVGADLIKIGDSGIVVMEVYYADSESLIGSCNIQATSSGEWYCNINKGFFNYTDVFVCIKGPSGYQIKGENTGNVSGFYDLENRLGFTDDYSIFAKTGKYDSIGSFRLDSSSFRSYVGEREEIVDYVQSYIASKYSNDCKSNCIVPVKFVAQESQSVTLSNLVFDYDSVSGNMIEDRFYDVKKDSPKLNSGFLILDLEPANFTVPEQYGEINAAIRLTDNSEIIKKKIQIKKIPLIKDFYPVEVAAFVPASFSFIVENAGNVTYKWDFGDGSEEEVTKSPFAFHTYQSLGNFSINIKMIYQGGEINRSFDVSVVSPKEFVNKTLNDYKKDVLDFERQIKDYPVFLKNEIERRVNFVDVKGAIESQEKKLSEGIDDEKAFQIMKELVNLKIPSRISISRVIRPSAFYLSRDQLDLERLTKIGAGKYDGSFDENYKKISSWITEKINVSVESKTYSVFFNNKNSEVLFSDVKFILTPKDKINEAFFIINGDVSKIKFSEYLDFKIKEDYGYVTISRLEDSKTIDFLYPGVVDLFNLPVVISPRFYELSSMSEEVCNFNGVCEGERGESFDNCSDCKKGNEWMWKILGLFLLAVIFFVAYILLQEWYKKHYESYLFKDRNQLFNLINFINNSEIRGIPESEIFKKLRKLKWSNEQIRYAYNKLHGKRTGMWEIPLFKGSEKREIREEIVKKQRLPPDYFGLRRF